MVRAHIECHARRRVLNRRVTLSIFAPALGQAWSRSDADGGVGQNNKLSHYLFSWFLPFDPVEEIVSPPFFAPDEGPQFWRRLFGSTVDWRMTYETQIRVWPCHRPGGFRRNFPCPPALRATAQCLADQ